MPAFIQPLVLIYPNSRSRITPPRAPYHTPKLTLTNPPPSPTPNPTPTSPPQPQRPTISNETTLAINHLIDTFDLTYSAASGLLQSTNNNLELAIQTLNDEADNVDSARISRVEEARLRRVATGSARDFFKGYVEVAGRHIDQGYVDESADAMGGFVRGVKGLWGKVFGGGADGGEKE